MEVIRGLKVSRKYQGPASVLANLIDVQGDNFMAIQFNDEFHDHPILNDSLSVVLEFLQSPMLGGIPPLQDHDSETGTFIFSTGVAWSLAETWSGIAGKSPEELCGFAPPARLSWAPALRPSP